jgi:DNA-binding response OmpR family regulator
MGILIITGNAVSGIVGESVLYISVWAALFCAMLIIFGMYFVCRLIIRRDHKKVEEQERELKRKHTEELNDTKQQALARVSRELQAPITMIIAPLQQMVNEPLPDDVRARVQIVLRNAQVMLHQINMLPVGMKANITPMDAAMPQMAMELKPISTPVPPTPTEPESPSGVDDNNAAKAAAMAEEAQAEGWEEVNHPFTMLVVDDSADMCRFVRDYFRGEYNVITASDGEQALKQLQDNDNIDLVVSDVTMPKMDGLELCRYVKTNLRWSHIPVILLTGRTSEEMEMEGLKLGADDYITKPFNVEMLRLRVKKLIEKKENRQKQFREKIDVAPSEITITSVDEEFIQKALRICEEHISDTEFSVEVLGQELSLSRTYLYKKLINITGKGPAEFIRTIRMKRAKQYLESGQMQIIEISAALGYNNPKRLTENFKTEYGISPSEYLKKIRQERSGKIKI